MQLPLPLPEVVLPADGSHLLPPSRRIYCNRSLRLDRIELVGFDMDYTLAVYNQTEIDRRSIEATARKLVERGYPERLLHMRYRTDFPIRGLLIDRRLGNVLKMDRYRYVKKAYHGLQELTREQRRQLYHTKRLRPGTKRYHWVDTLYALAEVSVYAAAVEALEGEGRGIDYDRLFADVRACIDLAHQDGSILDDVVSDMPRYIERDPEIGPALHNLRSSGKRLFLLTNSQPAYTERVMSYLLDGALPEYPSWKNYFDLIITAAGKPGFFTEAAPFRTCEGGARPANGLDRGRIYMGGNVAELEQLTGVGGDRVLYVGDHIYGDALRVKKESAWRTVMILQEMNDELTALEQANGELQRMDALEMSRDQLLDELREHQARLKAVQRRVDAGAELGRQALAELDAARARHRRAIDRLRVRLRAVDHEFNELEDQTDRVFHPFWGSLFKAGPEVSSFGDQVEEYACLYTTRVSNLRRYSPMHYFRSVRHRMPHEL